MCATPASKAYPADTALELGLDPKIRDPSNHLKKVGTGTRPKTCIVPRTHLDHLTSKVSSLNFCGSIIATHDRGVHDLTSVLPTTADQAIQNLLARRNGVSGTNEGNIRY